MLSSFFIFIKESSTKLILTGSELQEEWLSKKNSSKKYPLLLMLKGQKQLKCKKINEKTFKLTDIFNYAPFFIITSFLLLYCNFNSF